MSRLLDARPLWRAMLLLTLATGLSLSSAATVVGAALGDPPQQHDRARATQHGDSQDPGGQAAQRRDSQDPGEQAAQRRDSQDPGEQAAQRGDSQDPDERAARGEIPETGDDAFSAGAATLLLTPSTLVTTPGKRVRLTLSILGAEDLRRLPVTVRFDPAVVEIVSVSLGSAWRARQQPVLLHDVSRPGELIVGLGQLARDEAGISGSAELLELELMALTPGDAGIVLERFAAIGGGSKPQDTVALTASVVVR